MRFLNEPNSILLPPPPPSSPYQEAQAGEGALRPTWAPFARLFGEPQLAGLVSAHEKVKRQLGELGATCNRLGSTTENPWELDTVPLLISHAEWLDLESGLQQRARLFNALLRDLYGEQRLLRENLLPAELVYEHPTFQRACLGLKLNRGVPLALHAVNLARGPDGSWRVISDRTQSPAGLGYTLANRIVLSKTQPGLFKEAQVRRLAPFFMALRDCLRSLAVESAETTTIALLTEGPTHETFFEQNFLARYLGLPLVEGGDLIYQTDRIWIKTLDGLRQVDVLLRQIDDAFCDPLELRSDSCLGVPGLLQAGRNGTLAVVNAPGAAWLETPALSPFLPALCETFLREKLRLQGLQSWWGGRPGDLDFICDNLDSLVLKHTFGTQHAAHAYGAKMNEQGREALLNALRFNPREFVAQELLPLSQVPTLHEGLLVPRPVVFRSFVCSSPNGSWVLPGGLTRVATSTRQVSVSMQGGGISKDTWVLGYQPEPQVSLLRPATQVIRLERAPSEVPSRVADNLFWLGRYAERLEDTCRILRCVLTRLGSFSDTSESPELSALCQLLVKLELFPERFLQTRSVASVERESVQLIFQSHRLGTVREVLGRLQNLAMHLRERFSADTQRTLHLLHRGLLRDPDLSPGSGHGLEALNHLLLHLAAFSGLEMENMTRGHGWRFLDMGRRLERAVNTVTLLQAGLLTRLQDPATLLAPILEVADSSMTYRRLYFANPEWPTVIDLLMAEERNPRSFAFQIGVLAEHLQKLPGRASGSVNRELRQINSLRKNLSELNLAEITEGDSAPVSETLHSTLGRLAGELRELSNAITARFFGHGPLQRRA